ncbi:GNAT family N-acetyltransferase [Holophaga foetida]|uniref:GNAT family N-acetyltransferase n=1 Tax=Holophaga foetida TaxID=35839 RepID=UPI0002474950|nr:GNAT family N-acetyltransferase [Holophaga foetida]
MHQQDHFAKAPILFRPPAAGEELEICQLVERVFNKYVAPEYPQDGIQEFYRFANPEAMKRRSSSGQILIVAEELGQIIGAIETRQLNHIALLFVENQGKGIARNLVQLLIDECHKRNPGLNRITVNSSPYAEPVYSRLGFAPTGPSQTLNGITFIPMALTLPTTA